MKKIIYNIFASIIPLALFSCGEKDIMIYESEPCISLEIPAKGNFLFKDSLVFSFPTRLDDRQKDTLWFNATVMGTAVSYDREVAVKIISPVTTALENTHYKMDKIILPANVFSVKVPVEIYRTEDIKTQAVRLEFEVIPNDNFNVGYADRSKIIMIWGDFFLKPDIWDSSNYVQCFGEYTSTRYDFILRATKLSELPDPTAFSTLSTLNLIVREALYRYNQEHNEPLSDELGLVSFPVWGGASAG